MKRLAHWDGVERNRAELRTLRKVRDPEQSVRAGLGSLGHSGGRIKSINSILIGGFAYIIATHLFLCHGTCFFRVGRQKYYPANFYLQYDIPNSQITQYKTKPNRGFF